MATEKRKILISQISKRGFSKTVASGFGFGSWTIGETSIEIILDPPIDMTTEEGQEEYKKIKIEMAKMCQRALVEDIQMARNADKELDVSIAKREILVNNAIESE